MRQTVAVGVIKSVEKSDKAGAGKVTKASFPTPPLVFRTFTNCLSGCPEGWQEIDQSMTTPRRS
jgi:hypothetical protein